jgi:hypothetical protein
MQKTHNFGMKMEKINPSSTQTGSSFIQKPWIRILNKLAEDPKPWLDTELSLEPERTEKSDPFWIQVK